MNKLFLQHSTICYHFDLDRGLHFLYLSFSVQPSGVAAQPQMIAIVVQTSDLVIKKITSTCQKFKDHTNSYLELQNC